MSVAAKSIAEIITVHGLINLCLLYTSPVGIQCNHLEGIFLNILWRKNFYNNIKTGIDIVIEVLAPKYIQEDAFQIDVYKRQRYVWRLF